jgi:hypothetical protein
MKPRVVWKATCTR